MNHKKTERKFINKNTISSYLHCPICQEVFYDPFRLTCGYVYYKLFMFVI